MPIAIVFLAAVLSLMTVSLNNTIEERQTQTAGENIGATITQIARAMHLYHARNPGANGRVGYPPPSTVNALVGNTTPASNIFTAEAWSPARWHAERYYVRPLPHIPGAVIPTLPGFPAPAPGFQVIYDAFADTADWPGATRPAGPHREARSIVQAASRFGPVACAAAAPTTATSTADMIAGMQCLTAANLTDVQALIVSFPRSLDMTITDEFLPLNGERDMFGALNMLDTPAGDVSATINTQGHIEGHAIMNFGFAFTDQGTIGTVDTGDTFANDGILITNDGILRSFEAGNEFIRLHQDILTAYNTAVPPGATPPDPEPIEIIADTDTVQGIGTLLNTGTIEDVETIERVINLRDVDDAQINDTLSAEDASFDTLTLNP